MSEGAENQTLRLKEERHRTLGQIHMALAAESRASQLEAEGKEEDDMCKLYRMNSGLGSGRLKDFLLQIVRETPNEENAQSYYQAVMSVRKAFTWDEFLGAAKSAIAFEGHIPGESVPVLSISLFAEPDLQQGSCSKVVGSCCVTLLSGKIFSCSLSSAPTSSSASDQHGQETLQPAKSEAEASQESRLQPPGSSSTVASKERSTEVTQPALTVSHLADIVLAELPRHLQEGPPPKRVYIVLTQSGSDGKIQDVPLTPWDWNRPLSDFHLHQHVK